MENIKQEDLVETEPTSDSAPDEETDETPTIDTQDPLKTELDRVQKSGRTELEKAEFSLKKNAARVSELGGYPDDILGVRKEEPSYEDDDAPITRGEMKKIIATGATKTALQLADDIQDSTEKELVKYYIENTISPSGNPQDDLRNARRIANSVKNEQIVQEMARKSTPKTHSNSSSSPGKTTTVEPELTPQEQLFLKPPFNLTRETIIKSRTG